MLKINSIRVSCEECGLPKKEMRRKILKRNVRMLGISFPGCIVLKESYKLYINVYLKCLRIVFFDNLITLSKIV